MVEAFAADVSQHMRNTAHQYRKLAMCRYEREKMKGSVGKKLWVKVTAVLNEITLVPECTCALCKRDRNENEDWAGRRLAICDGVAQSDSQGSDIARAQSDRATARAQSDSQGSERQQVEPGGGP